MASKVGGNSLLILVGFWGEVTFSQKADSRSLFIPTDV